MIDVCLAWMVGRFLCNVEGLKGERSRHQMYNSVTMLPVILTIPDEGHTILARVILAMSA
jgi:hypothetical protein